MAVNRMFRTDPATGLVFHEPPRKLMRWNAVAAVVSLLVGGLLAIGVVLTRWQAVHLLRRISSTKCSRRTGSTCSCSGSSSSRSRCCISPPRRSQVPPGDAGDGLGRVLADGDRGARQQLLGAARRFERDVHVLRADGRAPDVLPRPDPVRGRAAHRLLRVLRHAGGGARRAHLPPLGAARLLRRGSLRRSSPCSLSRPGRSSSSPRSCGRWAWSSTSTRSCTAPSGGRSGTPRSRSQRRAHVSVWYAVAAIVFGAKPMSEKVSRTAFLLYILFLQLASAHHLLADPGLTSNWKIFNTSYAMYLAVLASMSTASPCPGRSRSRSARKATRRACSSGCARPLGQPGVSSMFISLGFGFLGGISGVMMGTEQLNLIIHNTIYVPGHFHATVVVGTTLAFMGLTYFLIPVLSAASSPSRRWRSTSPTSSAWA